MNIRNRVKALRNVRAADLAPNPKNWRTHPKAQQDALRGILAEVGYADALLARELPDGSLMLVDGHLRAETTPDQEVPVLILDINEAEADKLLLSLDPLAALAETNAQALDALLREVDTGSEGLQQMYADMAEAAELYEGDNAEIVEDEIPEPPVDPITKPGDLWLLGDHRLLCGDSTKPEDVERLMAGSNIDILFTSPPYSDQRAYDGNSDLSPEKLSAFITQSQPYADLVCVNLGMKRDRGVVVRYWDHYISAAESCGLGLLSWNVWDRSGFGYTIGQATAMFTIDHEFVFVFGRESRTLNKTVPNKTAGRKTEGTRRQADGSTTPAESTTSKLRQLGTVFRCDVVKSRDKELDKHPAMFPVAFPAAYIAACCSDGGSVYEPFCGSGTTLIAAEQLGRKCYGMEISPAYCDVIVKRWETLTGKKAELEASNGQARPAQRADDPEDSQGQPRQKAAQQKRAKTAKR
jgi:DNA modification methylase